MRSMDVGPLPANKWDACAVWDSRWHKVTDVGYGVALLCGGASLRWGYRHIKAEHKKDYESLVYNTNIRWEDLMYWGVWYAINSPEAIKSNSSTHKACRSRQLLLYNRVTGQLISAKVYRVIYTYRQPAGSALPNGTILTTLPDRRGQCDSASVAKSGIGTDS